MKRKVALVLVALLMVVSINGVGVFADGGSTINKIIDDGPSKSIECEGCYDGVLVLDDVDYSSWNIYDVYACWYSGCMVTKFRRPVVETYRCTNCNYATTFTGYEYITEHSVSH